MTDASSLAGRIRVGIVGGSIAGCAAPLVSSDAADDRYGTTAWAPARDAGAMHPGDLWRRAATVSWYGDDREQRRCWHATR